MTNTEIIDCTTCKYGYKDEQLSIPMCHHPKRFSEDCVDFNMHEEKPAPNDLEEAAKKYALDTAEDSEQYSARYLGYKDGAKWQKQHDDKELSEKIASAYQLGLADKEKQMLKEAVEADVNTYRDLAAGKSWAEFVVEKPPKNLGDKVRIIIVKED